MNKKIRAKVLVLGGGPGGYVAAIRCGQLGLDTILVDADRLGGTCLIRGCIPSKAIIHAAAEYEIVRRAIDGSPLGVKVTGEASIDLSKMMAWKAGIVDKLSAGVGALLKRAKVRVEKGWGVFVDAKTCHLKREDGETLVIEAENVVLAAGSEAVELPILRWNKSIISSTEALSLPELPKNLAVIGAGYIGLELGTAFRQLGSNVCFFEAQGRVLSQYDLGLTAPVEKSLKRLGIEVNLQTSAIAYDGKLLSGRRADGTIVTAPADKVLVTVGRRPRTTGWGLESMAVDMAGQFIKVDERCQTSTRGVWAIGDLVGEPMLAHKASAQGEMVAEIIAGNRRQFKPLVIPAVCFTNPEVVVVGENSVDSDDAITAVFPFSANGRALSMEAGDDGGFVRVIAQKSDHRILQIAAVGQNVSELSGEMVTLIEMGGRLEDVGDIIHAHPTQSEAIHEASLRALGHAIHI